MNDSIKDTEEPLEEIVEQQEEVTAEEGNSSENEQDDSLEAQLEKAQTKSN